MPTAPLRPCVEPGCAALVQAGRCQDHARQQEQQRGNREVRKLYYRAKWKRLREQVLREQNHHCAECGQVTLALEVDHIVKHGGDPERFHQREGLQGLCKRCHSVKTGRGE